MILLELGCVVGSVHLAATILTGLRTEQVCCDKAGNYQSPNEEPVAVVDLYISKIFVRVAFF